MRLNKNIQIFIKIQPDRKSRMTNFIWSISWLVDDAQKLLGITYTYIYIYIYTFIMYMLQISIPSPIAKSWKEDGWSLNEMNAIISKNSKQTFSNILSFKYFNNMALKDELPKRWANVWSIFRHWKTIKWRKTTVKQRSPWIVSSTYSWDRMVGAVKSYQ